MVHLIKIGRAHAAGAPIINQGRPNADEDLVNGRLERGRWAVEFFRLTAVQHLPETETVAERRTAAISV